MRETKADGCNMNETVKQSNDEGNKLPTQNQAKLSTKSKRTASKI